ncbi:DUF86 domain-containing protein [Candidatus Pacearchaeota archaeon]|nr:DUF86 domain-containing protein [Candidatus Pacearchaeota archaeon]
MNSTLKRKEIIAAKLQSLRESIKFIGDNIPDDSEVLKNNRLLKNGIYKEVEFAIETVIDICAILNKDLQLGKVDSEDSIFSNLEKAKIFDKNIINIITDMKKFRNVLVHRYIDINDDEAYNNVNSGLINFGEIISKTEVLLKNNETIEKHKNINKKTVK